MIPFPCFPRCTIQSTRYAYPCPRQISRCQKILRVALVITRGMLYSLRMTGTQLRAWMTQRRYGIRVLAAALELHPSTVQRYRDGTLQVPRVVELALETLEGR